MPRLQMDPPIGGDLPTRFVVKVQHQGRPPAPWRWAIYADGQPYACRQSTASYRCAEDAWQAAQAVRVRLGPAA